MADQNELGLVNWGGDAIRGMKNAWVDPYLKKYPDRKVAIDGTVHKVHSDHPKGSFEKPLSRKEVEDKFRVYAQGRLPASGIEEIIAAVNALEDLPSTSALMDMLSPAQRRDAA